MTQKWKIKQTMSKIYKLYINKKPKRPRTQQYPYLGPKVVVVAGKLDPTVGQLCFRRIFQTVMNLRNGTTEMSSKGPKMVRGRYGSAWNGRKTPKSGDPRWCRRHRLRQPNPGASGCGWPGNFTGKIASSCSSSLASACARVVASDASHGQNPFGLQMGQNDPVQCSRF